MNHHWNAAKHSEEMILTLRGRDWAKASTRRQEQIIELAFCYWRARGFPHYRLGSAEIVSEYSRLDSFDISRVFTGAEVRGPSLGLRLANSFHPQMWSVPMLGARTPTACFADDTIFRNVLRKALRFFPERFAVNESNLRRMLQTYSGTARVSNFRATAAKAIYARYSAAGDRVLDFSAGYGGRLLGCLTLPRDYFGVDPCTAQINGLGKMLRRIGKLVTLTGRAAIHQACAEEMLPRLPSNSCALVFSSPPYFNNEHYSSESTQSYIKFPTYEQWRDGFLRPIIAEAHRILDPGGYFVMNIANVKGFRLADDTLQLAKRQFVHARSYELCLSQRPYLRTGSGGPHRREPLFVFRKRRSRSRSGTVQVT